MSFYEQHILPHLINCACTSPPIQKLRQSVLPDAYGKVLEVGMGSATNLEFYDEEKIEFIWGLEPSEGMRQKAQKNLNKSRLTVRWLDLPGENIPLEDNSVDTVLLTFTLCTIPDYQSALAQMKRVLKPSGQLLFCEHGLAESPRTQNWQNRLNPFWKSIAGGCNLNRPIEHLLLDSGFRIDKLEKRHIPKTPKFASYIYRGVARK